MEELSVDPRAAEAWDRRADELVSAVIPSVKGKEEEGWRPDLVPKVTLSEDDIIGELDHSSNSLDGRRLSLEFVVGDSVYSLCGDGYVQLSELCQLVLKNRSVRQYIAARTVEDLLREWVRTKFKDGNFQSFTTFLISECNSQISRYHVWVPIAQLHIEQSFSLGPGVVLPITRELIDRVVSEKSRAWREKMEQHIRTYQGHSAVAVYVDGERARAREFALEKAERVLAALSLLAPSALNCNVVTGAAFWGSQKYNAASAFFFVNEKLQGLSEGIVGPAPLSLAMNANVLAHYAPLLKALHLLLIADQPDSFAEKVVDALLVYRRTASSPDPAEKLIYVFVALEMIFLGNANEPVQDNVATRIAFLIGGSVEERRSIITSVKEGYALRSAFIHHGVAVTNTSAANNFLQIAWRALTAAISATQRFGARDQLIQFLEDRKLQ